MQMRIRGVLVSEHKEDILVLWSVVPLERTDNRPSNFVSGRAGNVRFGL